ncbi:class I SAM-dependent methyltransferase [Pseudooceanicola nitratireducens]|uniref:class I SAM-dependent methyltransferase n=1 Tax=Pseudooceanicola nitratireducens TaxID=517719 RepID=UPI0023F0C798|nr:class I SAM-dependent methyltransferase [Pseudooceanicola nitratireducens]
MDSKTFWNGVAESYAKRPIENMDQHERTVARAASYLTPGARVLEVGCGTGTIAIKLAPHAGDVLATDLSDALIDIARDRASEAGVKNVRFEVADIAGLPEGQFEAVMAFNVLHLIPDRAAAIRAMADRVAPGGVLVTKTGVLGETWKSRLLRPVIGAMQLIGKAPYVGFFRIRELEAEMEAAGLEIVESETMGGLAGVRFLVARKR